VNLASDESFQQAREWIHDCLHKHPNCPEPATPELPTRVVEILDDGKLRVHDTGGEASYAALSYCRGGIQAFETTLSSLKDRKEGFSMNFLPQTLQDGVKVATELGLRYIWIDSLCIVQDSPADKGKEITQMAQIYSNAYVTICAASAEKASDGFLKILGSTPEEPNASLDDDLIKMPYRAPDGEQGTILIREEAPYHSTWEPTSRRAWTLQERILSPRNLIYGSKLIWQCNTTQHSDGGVEDWSFDILGAGHRKFSSGAFKSTNPPPNPEIDFFTLRQVFQVWYDAVQEYTRRDLSYPSDKLPAMAGMAKAFHSLTGAAYLAGLWKSNLTHDLMWHTHPTVRYAKPATWRAPSWSWASTDNKVSFDKITPDCASLATIISCSVTPISATAPFGEVSDGVLELSAPYIKAAPALVKQMMAEQSMAPPPKENNAQMWNKSIIDMILGGGKDAKGEGAWEPDGSVGCVLLFRREWHWESEYQKRKIEEICYSGLVVEEVGDGSGRYRRVGAFFDQWKDWIAAGGENRSITVI